MSQRTPSLAIVPPLSGINNSSSKIPLLSQDALKSLNGRSPTLNTPSDVVKINPDELFTRNTILEIRGVQANLRADAEAKREELRLMVGERYRDLLQASTSIITVGKSSKQVQMALEEVKDAILSQDAPPPPKRTSVRGLDDAHLHVFQLLSAHMKLLLDAPEHLWRLMERRKYFVAAWLFLLTRVVHRALVKDSEQEEGTWNSWGIDVVEQFPIVQRQWETVSQFRTQIVHKATLSLREVSLTAEEACATMLALHVLDSRPMTDALAVFLEQRSKALRNSLQWKPEHKQPPAQFHSGPSKAANGSVIASGPKIALKEVKGAIRAALDILFSTVGIGRQVFQPNASTQSMMIRVLEHIQFDTTSSSSQDTNISDLYLTTQSLLSSLPSSTHFLLLPANIRSYRPFVDVNSQSTSVSPITLDQKLDACFSKSLDFICNAIEKWLGGLQSTKEVWKMRLSTRAWTESSGLHAAEKEKLESAFDKIYGKRISDIWSIQLIETQNSFEQAVNNLQPNDGSVAGAQRDLLASLFLSQPLPTQIYKGPEDSAFKKHKSLLIKQLSGRTPLLDSVVTLLERCSELIQQDISQIVSSNTQESSGLIDQLRQAYQPNADALCHAVFRCLDSIARRPGNDLGMLIFVNQLSMELALKSSFIHKIECSPEVVEELQNDLGELHHWILEQWQERTISQILSNPESRTSSTQSGSEPSYQLVQGLSALCRALCELGLGHCGIETSFTSKTLRRFILCKLQPSLAPTESGIELNDIIFLRQLAQANGMLRNGDDDSLLKAINDEVQKHSPPNASLESSMQSFLDRTQVLFAPLLPPEAARSDDAVETKSSILLPYGIPPSDQQYHPPFELAKSSLRFGLLQVGGGISATG